MTTIEYDMMLTRKGSKILTHGKTHAEGIGDVVTTCYTLTEVRPKGYRYEVTYQESKDTIYLALVPSKEVKNE